MPVQGQCDSTLDVPRRGKSARSRASPQAGSTSFAHETSTSSDATSRPLNQPNQDSRGGEYRNVTTSARTIERRVPDYEKGVHRFNHVPNVDAVAEIVFREWQRFKANAK